MGDRYILTFLCVLLGCTLVRGCNVLDVDTGELLSGDPVKDSKRILETEGSTVVARYQFFNNSGVVVSADNSYCGIGCSTDGLFSNARNGDIYEVRYNRPADNPNFFDLNSELFDKPAYILPFVCDDGSDTIVAFFYVVDANNNAPTFNTNGVSVNIAIPYSAKADDSLLPYYSESIWATDADAELETNGKVIFETDLPDSFQVTVKESVANGKPVFLPNIILQKDASQMDPAPTSFVLTAKDLGQPPMTSTITFSVTIEEAENIYPPVFVEPYYSYRINNADSTGTLDVVKAEDTDGLTTVDYKIEDDKGLDVSVNAAGVVSLNTPVPTSLLDQKVVILLVRATEKPTGSSSESKSSLVPFAVILPDPIVTTTTQEPTTTTPCNSCPPCVCTTTTEAPTTPSPSVEFERQQYSAEVIENVQGYNILTVRAAHSEDLAVSYALDIGPSNPARDKFEINSATGVIRTKVPLPSSPKSYVFLVSAFAGGRSDNAPIYIEVISGVNCGEPLFQEVLFTSTLNENTKESGFLQVFVADPTNVNYQIAGVFPDIYRDSFVVDSNTGNITCVEAIDFEKDKEVRVTVEARKKIAVRKADYSLATALVKIADLNDNRPVFVNPQKILAYPAGAQIDESVATPIAKFLAKDADSGLNAEIIYSVNSPYFYIDENDGVLFPKRTATECGTEGCEITILAKDKGSPPQSSDPLVIKVKFIVDEFVSVFTVKGTGSSVIAPYQVTKELTDKLGYDVMLISASPVDGSERIAANEIALSVFATDGDQLVSRTQFKKDFDAAASSITAFEVKGEIRQPDHGNQGVSSNEDLLAATIALSVVLGLVIIGAAAGFLYVFKGDALRRTSSTERLQSEGEDSISLAEVKIAPMPRINEEEFRASPLPTKNSQQPVTSIPRASPEVIPEDGITLTVNGDKVSGETSSEPPALQVTDLDQEYLPESPKPAKSAIKNSMLEDEEEKEKKGGVRFDAEPEVFEIPQRTLSTGDTESDVL